MQCDFLRVISQIRSPAPACALRNSELRLTALREPGHPQRVVNEIMRPVLGILTMSAMHPQPVTQLETLGNCVPAKSRYAFDAGT
jgi:hypothetical protein